MAKNWYKRSWRHFKKVIRRSPNMTRAEWDKYAHENIYFSYFTISAHRNASNWEELKKQVIK